MKTLICFIFLFNCVSCASSLTVTGNRKIASDDYEKVNTVSMSAFSCTGELDDKSGRIHKCKLFGSYNWGHKGDDAETNETSGVLACEDSVIKSVDYVRGYFNKQAYKKVPVYVKGLVDTSHEQVVGHVLSGPSILIEKPSSVSYWDDMAVFIFSNNKKLQVNNLKCVRIASAE